MTYSEPVRNQKPNRLGTGNRTEPNRFLNYIPRNRTEPGTGNSPVPGNRNRTEPNRSHPVISVYFFDIVTSKKAQNPQFFTLLTSKCASRHNGVHFFNISTSKSGPRMVCFVHFDFEMCFAPQRRALFRHRNFQKWSETVSFLHF